MSVRRHGSWGSTIACNTAGCPWKLTTGQVTKKAILAYAKSIGWERRQRRAVEDLCPDHARTARAERAARIARRDARRKMTTQQRREARNKQARDRRAAKRAPAKEETQDERLHSNRVFHL